MLWIKKIFAWLAGLIGALFVLILLIILLLPQLVNLELTKQKILDTVASETGGLLSYDRLEILYLPRPVLTLEQVKLSVRNNIECSLSALRVYPKIVPLLKGDIRLATLQVENPHFTYRMTSDTGKAAARLPAVTAETIRTAAASLLTIPAFQTPGLGIRIINGQLSVHQDSSPEITFQFVNARIHRSLEKLRLKLNCTSNLGRKITIAAHLFPGSLTGFGTVRVRGFRPHLLLNGRKARFFSPMVESQVDLNLKLQVDAVRRLRIELTGENPYFRFQQSGAETIVKSKALKVVANIREHTSVISFSNLLFDEPNLQVSGSLLMDQSDPEIRLALTATGIDVTALREAALTILGREKTVRDIFTIINGGQVPIITIHARGKNIADLAHIDNYIIRGNIVGGDIFIPGVTLQISKVRGEASIAGGLLTGTDITAQLGNSSGKEGRLRFGLVGDDAPFHLDIKTLADVTQLQPILLRLVGNKTFQNELEKIVYLSGTAEGRLVIGEQLDDLGVTVSVFNAHVFAEYARIPYPIVIRGGRYLLHSTRFLVDQVSAQIGRSEVRDLSIGFDWSEDGNLAVSAGLSRFDVVEFTDWLMTFPQLQPHLHPMQFLDGNISLSSFSIRGPVHRVSQWRYKFDGELEQLGFHPVWFSDPVWVESGRFAAESADESEISLQIPESVFRWGNSTMKIAGNARISAAGAELDADLSIDEINGPQISQLTGSEIADTDNEHKHDFWPKWIEGVLRVRAEQFRLGKLVFTPVEAGVILHPGNMMVDIHHADLCGISVPSLLKISPWKLTFSAEPAAAGTQMDALFTCLLEEPGVVTGIYEMTGNVTADTLSNGFFRSLDGHLQLTSQSGRIYRHGVLAKTLALLNLTEIFRGRLPDIVQEGFGYKTMKITGEFEDGKFVLREGIIDGSSMTIAFDGHYDLLQQTLDIDMLIAPLKTIDAILQNLPVVSTVVKGPVISIPFRVEGNWDSVKIRPVPVEDVDTNLLRTLNQNLNTESKPSQPIPLTPGVDPHLLGR